MFSLFIPVLYIHSAACIDKCRPDILISESTYATTIRDSKRCRERDFLKKVHESIERGGKVIVAVSLTLYFDVKVLVLFLFNMASQRETVVLIQCHLYFLIFFQVLIPVFALGRAQELCILLETFW